MPTVIFPSILKKFTGQQTEVAVEGNSLKDILLQITKTYPKIKTYLLDNNENVYPFVSIYLNDTDIRLLNQEATQVQVASGDIITIVPAIAGG